MSDGRQSARQRIGYAMAFGLSFLPCLGPCASFAAAETKPSTSPSAGFAKGSLTLQSNIGYMIAYDQHTGMTSFEVGLDYFLFNNLSLGINLDGYRAIQEGPDAWIGEISGTMRQHVLQFDRYTIFGDLNFGPTIASEWVPYAPVHGTNFNYIFRTGIGATARLSDDLYLMFGVHYFHLSNARLHGSELNPSMNGIEAYTGLVWLIH